MNLAAQSDRIREPGRRRILFAGYAPVHFVCFLPVYKRLAARPHVDVFLSGGFRVPDGKEVRYRIDGFYDPFPVDGAQVIPVERMREEAFDVLVCAHTSDALFPGRVHRSVQIFHGVSFKNLSVREKALAYDVICLPGPYHAEQYRKHGLLERAGKTACLLTGFPKTDPLVSGELDPSAVLRPLGLDPGRPTLLFAPTGDKANAMETMGEEVIRVICDRGDWNLLVKPHDHPKNDLDWYARLRPLESGNMRLVREPDIVPYLAAADLLITDASSAAVEYTLLDRPIVFLDIPKLIKKIKGRAPALDLDTYGRRIGSVVRGPDEVPAAVADALAHREQHGELRRAMARDVFYKPGRAAERVAGVILHEAGLEPGLPEDVVPVHARTADVPQD